MKYLAYFLLSCMAWGQQTDVDVCPPTCHAPMTYIRVGPKPEPMDIEPIKRPVQSFLEPEGCHEEGQNICSNDIMLCSHHGTMKQDAHAIQPTCERGWEYSCKKGSHRVLLLDEDGEFHCVRFPRD